jgi:rod shape-determining protein MreB
MGIFTSVPIYVNLYTNKAQICRLDTGQCITRESKEKFSNSRVLLGEFEIAEKFLKNIITELTQDRFFSPPLRILIHQMELTEGGLSSTEKRALRDSCIHLNAKEVFIFEGKDQLSHTQAIDYMNKN